MDLVVIGVVLITGLLVAQWQLRHQDRARWERRENRPADLQAARLFLSERKIRTRAPVPLSGRVDQVYQLPSGALCPVDTKRRRHARVYAADQVQVSVYGAILRGNGYPVSEYGYIRQVWNGRPRYLKVRLLTDEEIAALYRARAHALDNPDNARMNAHPAICTRCGHREQGRCRGQGIAR